MEVALREWPGKSQAEIAAQVGCGQGTVSKIQAELIPRNKLTLPSTRTGKDGKDRPTTYATRTTRTATSATFNPVLDGGGPVGRIGCQSVRGFLHRGRHHPRRAGPMTAARLPGIGCPRIARVSHDRGDRRRDAAPRGCREGVSPVCPPPDFAPRMPLEPPAPPPMP